MQAGPPPTPTEAYAPDFARRVGLILAGLAALIVRGFVYQPRLAVALSRHVTRAADRFQRLLARLAAGRLRWPPRPHTGGRPHPENLSRGSPFPRGNGGLVYTLGEEAADYAAQLEAVLAEPAARELLAQVPAVERILRPIRRLLGLAPIDPPRRPARPAPKPPSPPSPALRPSHEPAVRPPAWNWYGVFPPFKKPA